MAITLRFNGTAVIAYDNGSQVGSWTAISGNTSYLNPSYTNLSDYGPIPEGNWIVNPANIQNIANISDANYVASIASGGLAGQWPGVETAWGSERLELAPAVGTDTFGRGGFFYAWRKFSRISGLH